MLLKYDKFSNLEQYDGAAQKVSYAYDDLGRVTTRAAECGPDASKLTSVYEYVDGGYGTNSTTPLVKKITQNGISFEYEYDSRGNIVSEKRGNLTTTYAYDALGQLIRVNDPHENATWVYNYDRGGNILSKVKYAYTTGAVGTALETIPYAYGDANWKDKLTAYNGTAITYDAIGNPLNDGSWTYEWAVGRQLKKMSREGQSLSFKYDHNGMRVQKVLEHSWYPETTNYTYHGKLLTHTEVAYTDFDEVEHTDKLHFFYDAQSRPAKVRFNGTIYTYLHNLQGDIVGILDNNGNLVVEYKHDAWGKLLSTTGSLADTLGVRNPFRYRSYVYDEETELYYLRSRFYNSEVLRFINVDGIVGAIASALPANMFMYCDDSPVIKSDANGHQAENSLSNLLQIFVAIIIVAGTRIAEAAKAAAKVNEAAGRKVITSEQILKAAFNPIPEKIMSEIRYRAEGWYFKEKILFSYTEQPNQYVIYDLTPGKSIVRWDHTYEEYSLDRSAPLYQALDFFADVLETPQLPSVVLSPLESFLLGQLASQYANVRDITLPPTLSVSQTVIFESEKDKKYRESFIGIY